MKKALAVCVVLLAVLFFVPLSSQESNRYRTSFFDLFDTYAEMTIYAEDESAATWLLTLARDELKTCHRLFDIYTDYEGLNNLKTVNDNAGAAPVQVDQRIIDLLIFGKTMYERTDGRVNIALGSVLALWHEKRTEGMADPENASLPDMGALREAALHTDIENVVIDEQAHTVYLADPDMRLDVGAIAKGFATERAAELMMQNGANNALLSIGGNVRAIGTRGDGAPWLVGVQNPDMSQSETNIATVALAGGSMVTSGNYQRYYTVNGVRYHHIIDPKTLMPAAYAESVTILAEDSGIADALSTALFTVSVEQGREILSRFENAEALWIDSNGEMIQSDGFILE